MRDRLRIDIDTGGTFTDVVAVNEATGKRPAALGYDVAQEEKGGDYEYADEILGSSMRVHRTILPRVVFQIENLINLDRIPSKVKLLALPAKWRSESAPARVLALVDQEG